MLNGIPNGIRNRIPIKTRVSIYVLGKLICFGKVCHCLVDCFGALFRAPLVYPFGIPIWDTFGDTYFVCVEHILREGTQCRAQQKCICNLARLAPVDTLKVAIQLLTCSALELSFGINGQLISSSAYHGFGSIRILYSNFWMWPWINLNDSICLYVGSRAPAVGWR